ncbi:MAG: alpha/beta fold hydrolase [Planctomycetota bacterium]|jgi:pimeloyl-ACP methyl ester carboxylesterase
MKKRLIILVLLSLMLAGCGVSHQGPVRSFDEVEIAYNVEGKGEPVLVFVHGWSCSQEYWMDQVAHFAKTHQVVTIDLAGHGLSGRSRADYTIESFGKDIAGVVQTLDLDQVILIGHSMGGPVIAEAALQSPDRVICLVGADTFHDIEMGYQSPELEKLAGWIESDFENQSQVFVRQMFPPTADPELVGWVAADMSSADPEIAMNVFRNLGKYDLKCAAGKLDIPIYSINADLWPTNQKANQKCTKTFKLKLMPGMGHFVMLEDPKQFNRLLEEVIEEL